VWYNDLQVRERQATLEAGRWSVMSRSTSRGRLVRFGRSCGIQSSAVGVGDILRAVLGAFSYKKRPRRQMRTKMSN
jgi:hypothetical protein